MTWIPTLALFLVAWLAAFAQTQFRPVVSILETPVGLLPALMVYASLSFDLVTVTCLAAFAGLSLDALSSGPTGVSIVPLFAVGFVLHLRRHLILRDQTYAQFWLGLSAGLAVPFTTLLLLELGSTRLIHGPFFVIQLGVLGLLNGVVCPAMFRGFDAIRRAFDYPALPETPFRPDREIKRGRL
ncbi:MAG: hypothetical protein JNL10_00625 [Verrucomicrobiales bacterium]|nr:hypothetical protein [Verrucomicrobiales bacterium]